MATGYVPVPTREEVLDPIGFKLRQLRASAWARIERAIRSRDDRVALTACSEVLKRTDRVPKDSVQITTQGPTLIVWDLSATPTPPRSLSASDPTAPSAISSNGSPGNGFPSWSAIEDSGRPPSP